MPRARRKTKTQPGPGAPRGNKNALRNPGNRSGKRGRGKTPRIPDEAILRAYAQAEGSYRRAARSLGMDIGNFWRRMQRLRRRERDERLSLPTESGHRIEMGAGG